MRDDSCDNSRVVSGAVAVASAGAYSSRASSRSRVRTRTVEIHVTHPTDHGHHPRQRCGSGAVNVATTEGVDDGDDGDANVCEDSHPLRRVTPCHAHLFERVPS